ncbi:MAG: hypothetical protein MK291_13055 [Planctomycetes bacterium]|nr:hypothetical protein [Planctomycetota bacterium]
MNPSQLSPLEGTQGPRRALFIKRQGTLLSSAALSAARFTPELLVPGAVDALFRASQAGWSIYLLGNEDEVAHGRMDIETWERFEDELLQHLRGQGVCVVRSYSCTDDPIDGVGAHRKESVYRLPNTGAMYHAKQAEGVELKSSWIIGNDALELAAGWRAGCLSAGILGEQECITGSLETDTAFVARDLPGALQALITAVRAA